MTRPEIIAFAIAPLWLAFFCGAITVIYAWYFRRENRARFAQGSSHSNPEPSGAARQDVETPLEEHEATRRKRSMAELFRRSYGSLPQSVEVEAALLGAILANNEVFSRVSDFLEPAHFYDPLHARIFEATGHLVHTNKIATPTAIETFLSDGSTGNALLQYLERLATEATSVINAENYGRIIYDLAILRSRIEETERDSEELAKKGRRA